MNHTESLQNLLEEVHTLERQGDVGRACELLDNAAEPLRQMGRLHYVRGALAFRAGDVVRAISSFERAVELEPRTAEYQSNLGAALFERARRTGALMPGVSDPRVAEDLHRAAKILELAATLSPELPDVFNNLGMARAACGQPEAALEAYDRALEMDARDVHALYNRAAALHLLGREQECLAVLDRLIELAPDFAPARASRENTLRRLGR